MKIIIAVVIACMSSVSLYAETSVWKISNGDNVLYIGGTVHVLRASDYPLPDAFDTAFEKSDIMVFETLSDGPDALLNDEQVKTFLEECNQLVVTVQENDELGRFLTLSDEFSSMITRHPNAYNSINDETIQLSNEEWEIRDRIFAMANRIQKQLENEDVIDYLERVQKILAMGAENEKINFFTRFMNPGYQSLDAILGAETFHILESLCDKYDYPVINLKYWRPYIAYTTLSMHVLSRFAQADGVDIFFIKKAKERGKQIECFETDEFQYNLIANLGGEYGDSYYAYLFGEFETDEGVEEDFDQMVDAWKRGEMIEIMAYEKEHFPAVYESMVANRNNAWLPVIENYLKTSPVEFILVGTGHISGPDGLLTQLEKSGYKIEQNW
jgi:uncharacterized protein YbaP (TraB family)